MIGWAAILLWRLINGVCHHPLGKERIKRFNRRFRQMPGDLHRAGEKAGIKQVQNRMLNAADILIDVHPICRVLQIGGGVGMGRSEAGKIPRRIDERVHRVSFALGCSPTGRAGTVAPCRMAVQWIAGDVKGDVIRQLNRQVFFFLRDHATGIAMYHRDGAAPIALAAQPPVAQAEFRDALTDTVFLAKGNGSVDGFIACLVRLPRETAIVKHGFGFCRHISLLQHIRTVLRRQERRDDRQVIFGRKFKIAFVMGRAAENGTGAIVHQNKVCDVDRQFMRRIKRMAHTNAGVMAQLFGGFDGLLRGATPAALGTEGRKGLVVTFQRLGQGVIWRDTNKRRAHQCVRPGCIDLNAVMAVWRIYRAERKLKPS